MIPHLARPVLLACSVLAACGEDTPADTDAPGTGGASEDTGEPGATNPLTSGDEPTTAAPSTDAPDPDTGDDTTGDTGDDTTTTGEPSPWDGEPLPPDDDGVWNFVDFPDARCRDGSGAGIGVRYGSGDGLVVYFQGGGACFNALTCATNPSSFNGAGFNGPTSNFFSLGADNPVGDWSFIFVPYCTGDVHAGARPDGTLPDNPAPQQFVGYTNVGHYLERIVPTFAGVGNVLVTGESAGGFGAAFNYDRIADAFPGARVSLLDDSGPPMSDDYMPVCLQKQWRDAWNLDESMPIDCDDCFPEDGGGIVHLAEYLGEKHSGQRLALISSLHDDVIRFFFGFGANDCKAVVPGTPADKFEAGLYDLRDNHLDAPAGVWGSYLIDSSQHTWIGGGGYFTQQVDGVKLVDWVAALVGGQTSHVSP